MAGISNALYQHVFPSPRIKRTFIRKNAIFLTTIFAGAFAFEIAFDTTSNKIWDTMNAGRQWKDIKFQYMNNAEEDDE
ncbi:hypothetical protein N7462_010533 [Penicillium macrosclerotiorum]|uniref:uncharacterized protein n=1 Tax=Penicillium macrosclerotiorum TaxID=303699 RepID=UPI002546A81E|nr:uncharacterized protein N7462_010533 [Penicillium macrosclerotiorum]KAJ5669463.1 hypothetical protein N7462_010533 [Penicillium macrosclerotiorum]